MCLQEVQIELKGETVLTFLYSNLALTQLPDTIPINILPNTEEGPVLIHVIKLQ